MLVLILLMTNLDLLYPVTGFTHRATRKGSYYLQDVSRHEFKLTMTIPPKILSIKRHVLVTCANFLPTCIGLYLDMASFTLRSSFWVNVERTSSARRSGNGRTLLATCTTSATNRSANRCLFGAEDDMSRAEKYAVSSVGSGFSIFGLFCDDELLRAIINHWRVGRLEVCLCSSTRAINKNKVWLPINSSVYQSIHQSIRIVPLSDILTTNRSITYSVLTKSINSSAESKINHLTYHWVKLTCQRVKNGIL